jgi:flagellar protein FlaI
MNKKAILKKIKANISKLGPQEEQPEVKVKEAPRKIEEVEPIKETKSTVARISLPSKGSAPTKVKIDYFEKLRAVDETYPLTTIKVKDKLVPLAYARVKFDKERNQLNYNVIEPQIDNKLKNLIERTLEELHESLEVNFNQLKSESTVFSYINQKIEDIWKELGTKLNDQEITNAKYYIFREVIGLSKIDAIFHDPNIEDIACDGTGLPIFVFHRNPVYGEIPTNISFDTKEELDSFVIKLAQKCGRTVSVAEPLMDGSLQDGSRVQVTYGTDIARKGSNFTIRKFFRIPLTPIDLINFGTVDSLTLAYLWLAIEKEKSILISGTTATGTTTFLNVLAMFIDPNLKIVSIEDTAELQLLHTNWMPQVTRAGVGPGGYGEVDMDTLLKSAMRQRPDYLIVGEVRGKEANVLFHSMSTGHPGLSTLHADTVNAIVDRLTTRPIDLPMSLLQNLDIIVFLEKVKKEGKFVRRLGEVIEIEGYDHENKKLNTNVIFKWDPLSDTFTAGHSYILKKLAERQSLNENEVQDEILRRASILDWMKSKEIYHFRDVARIINMYYRNPQQLFDYMGR